MKVAASTQSCLFGAFQIPASNTLGEIDAELLRLQELVEQMSRSQESAGPARGRGSGLDRLREEGPVSPYAKRTDVSIGTVAVFR